MKLGTLLGIVSLALLAAVGCSNSDSEMFADGAAIAGDGEIPGSSSSGASSSGGGMGAAEKASDDSAGASPPPATSGGNGSIQAGTLTAGVWDDNKNFDFFTDYRKKNTSLAGALPFTDADHKAAHDSLAQIGPHAKLDVSLVVDTTGSMGDEIAYLQKEFDALAETISTRFPNSEQRWSLVLYKDTYDSYVVKWFDFRNSPAEFRTKLSEASASGGGDFPEAPDQALGVAHKLSWRQDASVAKLMFWVADAPHHDDKASNMATSIRGAQSKGIHIYPVASSGVDGLAELGMRSAAQLTGGRYVFLTDDSGVGGAHMEPSIPCYYVTRLDQAILRMVDIEMTGTYREPTKEEIVRTGGNPQSGACSLSNGSQVTIY